ncbi:MAG TPA: type II toxin-antitoxin system VapC family toxin [Tepidisphaeraceae bacterium]
MAVLDTTVLIDLLRSPRNTNHVRAARKIIALQAAGAALLTTRINIAELFVGVELSNDPVREEARVQSILNKFGILELDELVARRFGTIAASLQRRGQPSGDLDALIAAIALVNGQSLVTRNPKHFEQIPGLLVETY